MAPCSPTPVCISSYGLDNFLVVADFHYCLVALTVAARDASESAGGRWIDHRIIFLTC